jgi:hypothetical protein
MYDWEGPPMRHDGVFWYGVLIGGLIEGAMVLLSVCLLELLW